MIHLGDRLGLYRAMAGQGPMTAAGLAARTGLHERWLLEWLRSQAAAGLVDTVDGEVFELSPEGAEVLADEDGKPVVRGRRVSRRHGPARGGGPSRRRLPTGTGPELRRPRAVGGPRRGADAGPLDAPGAGPADPPRPRRRGGAAGGRRPGGRRGLRCRVWRWWPWRRRSRTRASKGSIRLDTPSTGPEPELAETGLTNVTLHLGPAADLPARPTYDFVLTLDCIHDMPRPGRGHRRHPPRHPPRRHLAHQGHSRRRRPGATTSATRCWP